MANIEELAAEVARLTGLMDERSQMIQRYNQMLKESAAREEHWKALYQAAISTPAPAEEKKDD